MAPERRDDVISLGFKSIVSGALTTCLRARSWGR
jgi:nucleoside permease NupC